VLEVADIFRDHGAAWRRANAGHVSLDQMKVMSVKKRCAVLLKPKPHTRAYVPIPKRSTSPRAASTL
jgi:hypothetical protein